MNPFLSKRLCLARTPTQIIRLDRLSKQLNREIYVWRDDLTGFVESGNKVRKLEFLFADAIEKQCNAIVTCGGIQSNHTRTATAIAKRLGFEITIVVSGQCEQDPSSYPSTANLLLNQIFGATIRFIETKNHEKAGDQFDLFLKAEADRLTQEGKRPYIIPLGGSNTIGCLGYLSATNEMLKLWNETAPQSSGPDSVFCAVGSGATYAGLFLGLRHFQHPQTRVYGVSASNTKHYFESVITQLMRDASQRFLINLEDNFQKEVCVFDQYVGKGYEIATDDDLKFYLELARTEGILLDPCYTGKAFQGMISELKKFPLKYGKNILFLHSGGLFSTFAYQNQYSRVLNVS